MTSFHFRPAARENVGVLIALAGASGSGKTFSALRLATGLAQGKPIAFIDTEARRGLHYADRFAFLHADMTPPFRPARFIEAIEAAEKAGAGVIIIDSASHEYDGVGGILEWADELAEKGVKSPGNWKEPKLAHRRMMQALLQVRASLIFCLRADEKIEIVREGGKTQVRPLGWMPICEKRFMFEMTASFTLTPDRPGRVNYDLPHKCQEQHRGMFPHDAQIGEEAGAALAAWARGATEPPAEQKAEGLPIIAPDGKTLAERAPGAWLNSVKNALAQTKDVTAWAAAMEPHLRAIYAAGHEAMVADAREAIRDRRNAA